MAKKKPQYPKRQEKMLKGAAITLGVVIVAAAAVIAGFVADKQSKSWAVKFDGQKISVEALRFFSTDAALSQTSSTGDYKDDGYNQLISYYTLQKAADSLGFKRTQEDLDKAKLDMESYKEYLTSLAAPVPKLSDAQYADYLSASALYTQLYDHYTANYQLDTEDFETQFADYYENGKQYWAGAQVKFIYNEDESLIDTALDVLADGWAFDDALRSYSAMYTEGDEITAAALSDLNLTKEMAATIMALEPGGHTDKLAWGDDDTGRAFLIFELESIDNPTEQEVRDSFSEDYTTAKKNELFSAEMQTWQDGATIEKNDKAYDALVLFPS